MRFALAEGWASLRAVKVRTWSMIVAAVVVVYVVLTFVLPHVISTDSTRSRHWETPLPSVVLGLIEGVAYGLLGVGLVLVYRTNRIINFAHGQIGAFAAAFFGVEVIKWHIPYWVSLPLALALAGGVGALSEAVVIRRLRKAPLVMSVVATLGLGQLLVGLGFLINNQAGAGAKFPSPPGMPTFRVGARLVTPSNFALLTLGPLVVIAIGAFLRFSRVGVALRGSAANPEAARMAGIFASRMSSLAWAIAGALAGFSAILTAPDIGYQSASSFGPSLLLRALFGAVLARMFNMPLALFWGAVLGVIEALLHWNFNHASFVEVVLFVIIVIALLAQRRLSGRGEEKGSWASVQALAPVPKALRELWLVRNLGRTIAVVAVAFLFLLPVSGLIDNTDAVTLTGDFAFVIVGLSVGVITGLAGQLSLGQFAIASIGAVVSYQVAYRTGSYLESFFYAGIAAAVVSVVIGLPALRIKGLLLTVTTLAFALVVPNWLLQQPWMLGTSGVDPGRPVIAHHALNTGKDYYYFGLAIVAVALLLARNIRAGGLGRLLIAVRDNEDAARAFTVPAALVKLQGFALAGFIAGLGGALYGHSLSSVGSSSFPVDVSTQVVVMAVVGGLSILSGPILGVLFVFVLPQFGHLDSLGLVATNFGLLIIIMYLPGGLATILGRVRDRIFRAIGRRAGIDVEAAYLAEASSGAADEDTGAPARAPLTVAPRHRALPGPVLEADGLVKSFGGIRAVRGVSLAVNAGETLGLIGPNGAGKTTTFELIAGFIRADAGTVRFRGTDVTHLSAEARGREGLIRSFQDAALFPTLTVLECVQLAMEKRDPTRMLTSVSGWTRAEKRKEAQARELVSWMGLDRYRSAQVQALSTGTRRIAEIACLVGLEPEVLLLDEPAAGVAQKETEALGALLVQLKAQLDLTLVIIEHDIPLVMDLSDRIVCMADGEVIAAGPPDIVRTDPRVVESYLGGDITAIERSGARRATGPSRRTKPAVALAGSAS
ncbi:MAG TPA: ATP-binding cassette domain-containing protein [Mycobacteriales bacterium]|nr:ATP-binding cassette domain-containing protein [Mycobacteriales bacterium]